jgi:hypothetical protein
MISSRNSDWCSGSRVVTALRVGQNVVNLRVDESSLTVE